jgi:hypothetical protein
MIYSLGQNGMPSKFCRSYVKVMKFSQIYAKVIKLWGVMAIYEFLPKLCQSFKFCQSYQVMPSYAKIIKFS